MPDLRTVVVDAHSHIFNAEDLPIDGFIKKLSPAPRLLTGIVSRPLDRLTAWAAPGSRETEVIVGVLQGVGELETAAVADARDEGIDLISDEELDALFQQRWEELGLLEPSGRAGLESTESAGATDDELADALANASPGDRRELEDWIADWAGADGEQPEVTTELEGLGDVLAVVRQARRAVRRYLEALRLITTFRYRVASDVATTYPQVELFVPALVDFSGPTRDRPSTPVPEQITIHSMVAKLSVAGRVPDAPHARLHPMVGFDPYREISETRLGEWDPDHGIANPYIPYAPVDSTAQEDKYRPEIRFETTRARPLHEPTGPWDTATLDLSEVDGALDLVRHAVELGGFAGVKIYPPAGFLPVDNPLRFSGTEGERLDAALRAQYGYCEVMEVPILTHAAHSNGFEDGWDGLAGPLGWERVLADYPKLRVCFGHFGHLHGVGADPANPAVDAWPRRFVELIDRYPHVYADVGNSKFPISENYRARFLSLLGALLGDRQPTEVQTKRRRRIMYGSDYWMNTMSPSHHEFLEVFSREIGLKFDAETRDAFMGRNALRWLGLTGEDDEPDLTNLNQRRLAAFYGPHDTPAWLPRGQ